MRAGAGSGGGHQSPTEWQCGDHWLHCGVQQLQCTAATMEAACTSPSSSPAPGPHLDTVQPHCCCISHDFVTLLPSPNGYPLLMLFWRKCLCQWPVYIATHCHAEQSASVQRPLATPPLSHHILARPWPPALRDEDHSLQLLQTIQQRKPME